jgi:four helix bundle protein
LKTQAEELKERTIQFALEIVRLFRMLPQTKEAQVIGNQVLRSGTSVGANYRATCRARSKAEFIAKVGNVVEEADETGFWLDLMERAQILRKEQLAKLRGEAGELLAIFAASQRTARSSMTR